eukprot:CAMPEP_0204840840 /NCGR_PEP_ID=MMETSP1346-20131115/39243_1 /ASSEMBLY_ACC=CAM_ASM_000771 /TAXON_ID=215587 /ORGANISM="Aplanochytrium stocchinoi, Strain GSBS06" /LENGTH=498 /DNA_ID=CAMNT_0051978495 /DNA_START=165 /DNA_END=1658 /DNA_ORIENTATION=+
MVVKHKGGNPVNQTRMGKLSKRKKESQAFAYLPIGALLVIVVAVITFGFISNEGETKKRTGNLPQAKINELLGRFKELSEAGNIESMKAIDKKLYGVDFPPVLPVLAKGWMNIRYQYSKIAVRYLHEFIKEYPSYVDKQLLSNLGYLSLELNEKKQAEEAFRSALEKDPNDGELMVALAESLRAQGGEKMEEANAWTEKAAKHDRKALAFWKSVREADSYSDLVNSDVVDYEVKYIGFTPKHSNDIAIVDIPLKSSYDDTVTIIASNLREVVQKRKPLLVRGGSDKLWPGLKFWVNDAYLKEKAGKEYVYAMVDDRYLKGFWSQRRLMRLEDFINNQERYYLTSQKLAGNSAFQPPLRGNLSSDFKIPPLLDGGKPKSVNFWFGNGEKVSRLHHDDYENLAVIVEGRKRYILCSPAEAKMMNTVGNIKVILPNGKIIYHESDSSHGEHFCLNSIYEKNVLSGCVDVEAHSGDLIYIPGGWFHQVKSTGNPKHKAVNIW